MSARVGRGILVAAMVAGLAGCSGTWGLAAPVASASPSPSAIVAIVNDLAAGSTTRELTVGNIGLSADYYSTLAMDQWTAAANKPLTFSLLGSLVGDEGQGIYLSRVTVAMAVTGPDGPLPAPAPLTDQTTITPGYLVKSPYTYSQTFILPAVDAAATSIALSFTYELLLQTTPTSTQYAKQTATDLLTIAIAAP
ncbi:MAG: hypothetical protein H7146_07005 [Burkholderiaceae bacterium]|nr:hypothetical protein [Microbacteriaceae bacterium]